MRNVVAEVAEDVAKVAEIVANVAENVAVDHSNAKIVPIGIEKQKTSSRSSTRPTSKLAGIYTIILLARTQV